jgi:hypothetical protein
MVCLAHFLLGSLFLESNSAYSAITTKTPTKGFTNLSVPPPSTVNTLFLDCPALSSTTYTAHKSSNVFALTCDMDYPSYYPGNEDIIDIVAYSMQDCMQACSELAGHGFAPCAGATFLSIMSAFPVGNCYLKGSLGTPSSATSNAFVFGKLL